MPKTAATGAGEASGCKLEFPTMDKVVHASIGRLTGGISPAALSLAYTDWIQHLIASPDKQIELAHAAAVNLMCFIGGGSERDCPVNGQRRSGLAG